MTTVADAIYQVRRNVKDLPARVLADADIVAVLNDGIERLYDLRPDLLFDRYELGYTPVTAADQMPVADWYLRTLVAYTCAVLEGDGDDVAKVSRAELFMRLFEKEATT